MRRPYSINRLFKTEAWLVLGILAAPVVLGVIAAFFVPSLLEHRSACETRAAAASSASAAACATATR